MRLTNRGWNVLTAAAMGIAFLIGLLIHPLSY